LKVSRSFNRYYHAILREIVSSNKPLKIVRFNDKTYNFEKVLIGHDELIVVPEKDFNTLDDLKQLLKHLDSSYPRSKENGEPISTKDLTNKELLLHVSVIEHMCRESGIELDIIRGQYELYS
jgi:hypothetical protein